MRSTTRADEILTGLGPAALAHRCARFAHDLSPAVTSLSRRSLLAALSALALPLAAQPSWPAKPVRIIVAYPAGGVSDAIARVLGEKLAAQLGQPVVVENKAGASGTIGMDAVAKAAPDGYTLGFSAISPLVLSPHLGKLPFDPLKDIAPVASVMYSPVLLLATPAPTPRTSASCWPRPAPSRARSAGPPRARRRWATSCWSSCRRRPRCSSRTCRTRAAASRSPTRWAASSRCCR